MCGFTGFIDFNNQISPEPQRLDWLMAMGQQLARRGPDDQQIWDGGGLSFLFRRLAIVDTAEGQQPIWNEDSTLFVAVNGEIYNHLELRSQLREPHEFRTRSDAEIVLHLYEERGPDALQLLNGMFAIAIWDTKQQQLFLARDRLGIKPLYYSQVGSQLIFGSELKSLLVHPNCPNRPNWLDLKTPTPQASYVQGIQLLPAGHYLLYSKTAALNPTCYWSIEQHFVIDEPATDCTPEDYVVQYRELFVDSVKKRLMADDMPIGIFLSGGVDSSAIAAVAAQQDKALHCFTVVEPCTIAAGDAVSAQQVAKHLQLPFHPVLFDQHVLQQIEFSLAEFEYLIWMMDSPRFDLEWFFKHELHRYAKTVVPELKVMLLGQGADEFAGGYSNPAKAPVSGWQAYLQNLCTKPFEAYFAERQVPASWMPWLETSEANSLSPKGTPFHREMLYRVMELQRHNLWHEDRTASSQGIESRVPFLDYRLVELLASVPAQYQAALFWDKAIIRQAAQPWLPKVVSQRSKVRFFHESISLASVYQLLYQLLSRVFPEFCDKYLSIPAPLFSKTRLTQLFDHSNTESEAGIESMQQLINCMAMTIFQDLCQTRLQNTIGCLNPPSPLQLDFTFGLEQSSPIDAEDSTRLSGSRKCVEAVGRI